MEIIIILLVVIAIARSEKTKKEVKKKKRRKRGLVGRFFGALLYSEKSDFEKLCDDGSKFYEWTIAIFWGVFGPWRRREASYTTDERSKNGQEERWRLNLEEINLQIKSSSEKFRRLYLDAMQHSMVDASEVKLLLFTALTDMIDDRETFMKGIDYSYYYEQED